MSLQFGLIAVSSMALQFVVNGFGTTAITAFTATNRIEQFFGSTLISFFVSKEDDIAPQVIELGAKGLKITSLFYLSLGLIYVVRGVLTGLGDAFFALLPHGSDIRLISDQKSHFLQERSKYTFPQNIRYTRVHSVYFRRNFITDPFTTEQENKI